jgi:hypothetical protein
LFFGNDEKVTGLDYNAFIVKNWSGYELANILLNNLKMRLHGNRVPLTFGIHSHYYGNSVNPGYLNGLKMFIDSALTYPEVRFVTGNQLIDWMENPVGLDGTTGGRNCEIFVRPTCCPLDQPIYDTICGGAEIVEAYKNSILDCPDNLDEYCNKTSVKFSKNLQNKTFFATLVKKSLNISLESGKSAEITVFDTRGRLILRRDNVKNNTLIPLNGFSGVYFIKAVVGNNTATQKIVLK